MSQPFRLRPRNASPEAEVQKRIAAMLRAYLPDEVWFTASLSGVQLSPPVAARAKAAGMEKGAPDFSFIFPDGRTRYLEVKSTVGVLTAEQKRLRDMLAPVNAFAVVRSWEEARGILRMWLAEYGLALLTDAESLRREAQRRAA